MATIDPVASALDTIAAHYLSEVGDLSRALRGWPEHNQDLKLGDGPVLALTLAQESRTLVSPRQVDQDGDLVTYKIGMLRMQVQMDLWANYRAVRDKTGALVLAASHNRVPYQPGLFLTQGSFYSRPLNCTLGDARYDDAPNGVSKGIWRMRWDMEVVTDVVVQATVPQLQELNLELALTVGSQTA